MRNGDLNHTITEISGDVSGFAHKHLTVSVLGSCNCLVLECSFLVSGPVLQYRDVPHVFRVSRSNPKLRGRLYALTQRYTSVATTNLSIIQVATDEGHSDGTAVELSYGHSSWMYGFLTMLNATLCTRLRGVFVSALEMKGGFEHFTRYP